MGRRIAFAGSVSVMVALLLTGCGGGGSGGGAATGNLTVTARVISGVGAPIPNVLVWISGNGPFITGLDGVTVATGMPSPYDVVIVDGGSASGEVWMGLTRPDPVFTLDIPLINPFTSDFAGTVSGGIGWPVPATHRTTVSTVFANSSGGAFDNADPTTGAYSTTGINWFGPTPASVTMVATQFLEDMNGNPVSFTGFGALAIPALNPSDVLTNLDIVLAPVATTTITGTLNLPPGMTAFIKAVLLEPPAGGYTGLSGVSDFMPGFQMNAPVAPGFARHVLALAGNTNSELSVIVLRKDLPDPATNVMIDVPDPTGLVLPVIDATGIDHDSVFQITPSPGGRAFSVQFLPESGIGARITVHTLATSFTIPDLSSYGLSIAPGVVYTWEVIARGPVTSLDDVAVSADPLLSVPLVSNGTGDGFITQAGIRKFTFAP